MTASGAADRRTPTQVSDVPSVPDVPSSSDAPAPNSALSSSPATPAVPVVVLGGSGYVAGEALRLLAGHPHLALAGISSESAAGEPVAAAFPHLAAAVRGLTFTPAGDPRQLVDAALAKAAALAAAAPAGAATPPAPPAPTLPATATPQPTAATIAVICAAPHGIAARQIDALLRAAESAGADLRIVDLSADFRFAAAADYERVYGHPHGAPARLAEFHCGLPEHAALAPIAPIAPIAPSPSIVPTGLTARTAPTIPVAGPAAASASATPQPPPLRHIGHPGCFPTSVLLAAVPLVRLGWIEPEIHVVAVTGSTGAGRTPGATTHHPARRSNLFAYSPLAHRHEPEMRAVAAAAAGQPVEIHFVPQAGPFARGIYATLQARLRRPVAAAGATPGSDAARAAEIAASLAAFYADAPFVEVSVTPPRLQDVVGSNYCRIGIAVAGDRLVACSAIDNLTKGAAGGGIQWLNRLLGFAETAGLTQPGIGWL